MAHESTRQALRELVRSMNSFYSNRIEGQGTSPANIQAALRNEYSDRPDIARLQLLARAHVHAERILLSRTEFLQMTGLGDRVDQALLAHLLETGLLVSDTPLGPVRIGLPLQALALLLPALYPEAGAPD